MKILLITILTIFCSTYMVKAQEDDIVRVVDKLTIQWDNSAVKMRTYKGMKGYCRSSSYRYALIHLLNDIHHYDSALYKIVKTKFNENEDAEAKATLDDIILLEEEYTTGSFLRFLRTGCKKVKEIESNFSRKGGNRYIHEQRLLQSELNKYVNAITMQIDIVDEHVHHLKGL